MPIAPPVSGPNTNVFVQQANTAGYSTTSDCTYFNVLKVTATDFQVQHKTCKAIMYFANQALTVV